MVMMKTTGALLALFLLCSGLFPMAQAAEDHTITMQDADIRAFIDDVSMATRKTFIVDPRVQGKVTIASQRPLNAAEVFEVFKDVMRVHNFAVIKAHGSEYRITLLQGAAQDAPYTGGNGVSGELSTVVIKLDNVDAAEAAKLIKPVLHSQGRLTATPGGNILVITDFPENLKKARAIVRAMDEDAIKTTSVILKNITAEDAEKALREVQGSRARVQVVALRASNSLILRGTPHNIESLLTVLQALDTKDETSRGAVSVIPLRFASGASLVDILKSLLPSYTRKGVPAPTVAHEPDSNSIIISASTETQKALEAIIHRLDVRRPQVLVEAIIVEVSDTAAKELGAELAIAGLNGSSVPFVSTNFSRNSPNILALTGAVAGDRLGLSQNAQDALETAAVNSLLGVNGGTVGLSSQGSDGIFNLILNAVENDVNSNILSTPFVTTMDNVPATFLVGQEIPITTGESLGSSNVNPFRTFERQDIGIKLNVVPQISEGDVIRLTIKQEVSSIAGAVTALSNDFVTNKREIETTVLANDSDVIVLGGLITDDEQVNISKIPLLGDAPVIGNLFRNKSKSRVRTNLMVFLRPTIIRDSKDMKPLTQQRLEQMRREDMMQSGRETSKLDKILVPQ